MTRAGLSLLAAALVAGCGGGNNDEARPATAPATPAPQAQGPISGSLPPGRQVERGDAAHIVLTAGCLACHRLGEQGNEGPGPALDTVGARLSEEQIREALVAPTAPMPSYESLPDLDLLVEYLSGLE